MLSASTGRTLSLINFICITQWNNGLHIRLKNIYTECHSHAHLERVAVVAYVANVFCSLDKNYSSAM